MTTETITAAKAANGSQMRDLLGQDLTNRTIADRLRDTAGSAKRKLQAVMETLHLGGVGQSATDAAKWLYERVLKNGWRRARRLGLTNIAGVAVTTPLRHKTWTVIKTVVKVATFPIRLLGRGLRWGLSKFGWGRKVVSKVEEIVEKIETKVEAKVQDGLAWLDRHDDHGAMTWLRWFFQASVARKAIRMFFPRIPGWAVYAVSLAIPVYGDRKSPEEEAAIAKAKEVLKDVPARDEAVAAATHPSQQPKGRPTPKRSEAKPKGDTVPAPTMTPSTVVLTDARDANDKKVFEAVAFTDENGVMRVRLGSQLLWVEELPDGVTIVGENLGEVGELIQDHEKRNEHEAAKIEAEVRAAQASPKGRPPSLPRRGRPAKKAQPARSR